MERDTLYTILTILFIGWLMIGGIKSIAGVFIEPMTTQERIEHYTFEQTDEKGECKTALKKHTENTKIDEERAEMNYHACIQYYGDYIYQEKQKIK